MRLKGVKGMHKQYELKVYPQGKGRDVYRTLAISGEKTLDQLCRFILESFSFSCDHLYEFCMDNCPYSANSYRADSEDGVPSTDISLDQLDLTEGQKFLFHYDFGDDWMFPISVMHITETERKTVPKILKKKGEIEQYPEWE